MTIDEIKARYPLPRSAGVGTPKIESCQYCCGGAILMSQQPSWPVELHNDYIRFPRAEDLARALRRKNPHLPEEQAMRYAYTIVKRNDMGLFEDAWYYAGRALTYTLTEE